MDELPLQSDDEEKKNDDEFWSSCFENCVCLMGGIFFWDKGNKITDKI